MCVHYTRVLLQRKRTMYIYPICPHSICLMLGVKPWYTLAGQCQYLQVERPGATAVRKTWEVVNKQTRGSRVNHPKSGGRALQSWTNQPVELLNQLRKQGFWILSRRIELFKSWTNQKVKRHFDPEPVKELSSLVLDQAENRSLSLLNHAII